MRALKRLTVIFFNVLFEKLQLQFDFHPLLMLWKIKVNKIDFTNIGVKFRSKLRAISLLIYSHRDSCLSPISTCVAHLVL